MKFIRRIFLMVTALVVLAIGGVMLWIAFGHERLYSSPTQVRTNSAYSNIFAPAEPWPAAPEDLLGGAVIITNEPGFEIAIPLNQHATELEPPYEVVRVTGGNPTAVGEGAISLQYIGVGYSVPTTNFDWAVSVPMKLFTADLESIAVEEAFPKQAWRSKIDFRGKFPQVKFHLTRTNLPHLKFLGWDLFDARTHWRLSDNRSYGVENKGFMKAEGECQTWRPMPVELALSIATGPVKETLLEPKPGAEARSSYGAVKLLAVYDRYLGNQSSSGDGRTNVVRLTPAQISGYDHGPISTFVFIAWPSASELPMEIEALDREGKVIPSYGGGSSGRLLLTTARAPLEKVDKIRVRSFEKFYRIVISLPEIPGLPPENRNVENLFDTHIPYIRLRYEHDLHNALRSLVQMESRHFALTYPNGYFPVTLTNVTPREILLEMTKLVPAGKELVADSKNNRIELRDPPLTVLWTRVRALFTPNRP